MPRIEAGPVRAIGAVDVRTARPAVEQDTASGKAASTAPAPRTDLVKSEALDPGAPPVDADRVEMIRKAVDAGTYPIIPTRIADAMIAARYILSSGR